LSELIAQSPENIFNGYPSMLFDGMLDGKKSQKHEAVSITEVTHMLRSWLCK